MADGKVNLTFSTIAQLGGLNTLSDGIKTTGRQLKDFGDAGGKVVGALSAQFAGPLKSAMQGAFDILRDAARGGLWGIMGAVAVKGISVMADKFEEAKKKAKELADIIKGDVVTAAERMERAYAKTAARISIARAEAKSLAAAQSAAGDRAAADKKADATARENRELLGAAPEHKAVVSAEASYARGMADAAASVEKSKIAEDAARRDLELAVKARRAAEDAAADAARFRAAHERHMSGVVAERNKIIGSLPKGAYTFADRNRVRGELAKFDEEHKSDFDRRKKLQDDEEKARERVVKAVSEEAEARRRLQAATESRTIAVKNAKNSETSLKNAMEDAVKAERATVEEKRRAADLARKTASNESEYAERVRRIELEAAKRKLKAAEAAPVADVSSAERRAEADRQRQLAEAKHSYLTRKAELAKAAETASAEAKYKQTLDQISRARKASGVNKMPKGIERDFADMSFRQMQADAKKEFDDAVRAANERTAEAREAADKELAKAKMEYAAGIARLKAESEAKDDRKTREEAAAAHKKKMDAMKAEVSAMDQAIAAQKKLAAEWERQAAGLRGKDFADLERERRDDAGGKAARAFERRNRANQRRAERLAAQEEFGRRHRTGGLSRRDADWLRRWREWQQAQDPKNNPAAKQAARLERDRDALQKKMQGTLEQIRNELRTANTIN